MPRPSGLSPSPAQPRQTDCSLILCRDTPDATDRTKRARRAAAVLHCSCTSCRQTHLVHKRSARANGRDRHVRLRPPDLERVPGLELRDGHGRLGERRARRAALRRLRIDRPCPLLAAGRVARRPLAPCACSKSRVPAQTWQRRAQSLRKCGSSEAQSLRNCGRGEPSRVQMWRMGADRRCMEWGTQTPPLTTGTPSGGSAETQSSGRAGAALRVHRTAPTGPSLIQHSPAPTHRTKTCESAADLACTARDRRRGPCLSPGRPFGHWRNRLCSLHKRARSRPDTACTMCRSCDRCHRMTGVRCTPIVHAASANPATSAPGLGFADGSTWTAASKAALFGATSLGVLQRQGCDCQWQRPSFAGAS